MDNSNENEIKMLQFDWSLFEDGIEFENGVNEEPRASEIMSDSITDDCFAFLDSVNPVSEHNQTSSASLNKNKQNRAETHKPDVIHLTPEELIKTNADLVHKCNDRSKKLDETLKKLLAETKERQRFEKMYKECYLFKEKFEKLSEEKQRNDPLIKALSDKVEASDAKIEELEEVKKELEGKRKSPGYTQKIRNAENKELARFKMTNKSQKEEIEQLQNQIDAHGPFVIQMNEEKKELLCKLQELTIHVQRMKENKRLVEEELQKVKEVHKVKENEKKRQVLLESKMKIKDLKVHMNGQSVPIKHDLNMEKDNKITELTGKLEAALEAKKTEEEAKWKAEEGKRIAEAETIKIEKECQSVVDGLEGDVFELVQQKRMVEKQLLDLQKKQSEKSPASSIQYFGLVEGIRPSLIASAFRLKTIPSFDSDRMGKCIAEFYNEHYNMLPVSPLSESSEEESNPALQMLVDAKELDPCASVDRELLCDHNIVPHALKSLNNDTVARHNTFDMHDDTHPLTSVRIFEEDTPQLESSHTYKDIPQSSEVRYVLEDTFQYKLLHGHRGTLQYEPFHIHKDTAPSGKPEHINAPDMEMHSKHGNNVDHEILHKPERSSETCDMPEISLGSEGFDQMESTSLSESNFEEIETFSTVTETAKNIYSSLPTENELDLSQSLAQMDPCSQKKTTCPVAEHECSKPLMLDAVTTIPSDSESMVIDTNGSTLKSNSDACEDRNEAILDDDVASNVTVKENCRGKLPRRRSFHLDDLYSFFPNKSESLSSTRNFFKSNQIGDSGGSSENEVRPKCALRKEKYFNSESINLLNCPIIKKFPALESSTNVCQNSSNPQTRKNSVSEMTEQVSLHEITQSEKRRRRWKSTSNLNPKTWHKDMCSLQSLNGSKLEVNGAKRDSLHEDDCNVETLEENKLKVDVAKDSLLYHKIENVQILQKDNVEVNLVSESESLSEIACDDDTLQESKLVHDSITETDSLHGEIPKSPTWQESKEQTVTSNAIADIGFEDSHRIQASIKSKLKINGTIQMNDHPNTVDCESKWPNISNVETISWHKDICDAQTLSESKSKAVESLKNNTLYSLITNAYTLQRNSLQDTASDKKTNEWLPDIQTMVKSKMEDTDNMEIDSHLGIANYGAMKESKLPDIIVVKSDSERKDICDTQNLNKHELEGTDNMEIDSHLGIVNYEATEESKVPDSRVVKTDSQRKDICDTQNLNKHELEGTDNMEIDSHLGIVNYEATEESKVPDSRVVKTDSQRKDICVAQNFNKHELEVADNVETDSHLDIVNYGPMEESELLDTKVVKTDSQRKDVCDAQTLNESRVGGIGCSRSDNLYREINEAQSLRGNKVIPSKVKTNKLLRDAQAIIKSKMDVARMVSHRLNISDSKTSEASKLTNIHIEKPDVLCDKSQDRQLLKQKKITTNYFTETGCSNNDVFDNSASNKIGLNAPNSLPIISPEPKTPAHKALKMKKSKINCTSNLSNLLQDSCHTQIKKKKKAKISRIASIKTAIAAWRNATKSGPGINMPKNISCKKKQIQSQISDIAGIDNNSNNLNGKRNLPPTESNCTNPSKKVKTKNEKKSKGAQDKNSSTIPRESYRQIKINVTSSKHPLEEALDVLEGIKFKRTLTDYNQFKHCFVNSLKNPAIVQSSEEIVTIICKYLTSSTRDPFSSFIKGNLDADCLVPRIELCVVDSLHGIGQKENSRFSSLMNQFLLKISNYILEDETLTLKGLTTFCRVYAIFCNYRTEIKVQRRISWVWELLYYLTHRRSEVFPFVAASILSAWRIAWTEKTGDDTVISKKFILKAMLQPPHVFANEEVKNNWVTCHKTIKALFEMDIPMVQNESLAELREAYEQMRKSAATNNVLSSLQENSSDVDR